MLLCSDVLKIVPVGSGVELNHKQIRNICSPVMNTIPAYSGARISGCWTLRSDGR